MGFFDNFFKKKSSGEVAKDRLKLLLVSDRSNCSPQITQSSEESEGPALYANIPIRELRK